MSCGSCVVCFSYYAVFVCFCNKIHYLFSDVIAPVVRKIEQNLKHKTKSDSIDELTLKYELFSPPKTIFIEK